MREIALTATEYREFVWQAVQKLPSKDVAEAGTQRDVSRKLKALGYELPLSERDTERAAEGALVYHDYATSGDVALLLEEEEWRWLKDRLRKYLPALTGYASDDFLALLDKVDGAEKVEVAPARPQAVGE